MSEKSQQVKDKMINSYRSEVKIGPLLDLGNQSPSRSKLRVLARNTIIETTKKSMRKNYSSSQASSHQSLNLEGQSMVNALKMLMKERLIVTRLGFPDKAMELDREIEIMRKKAHDEKKRAEDDEVEQRMRLLTTSHVRKEQKLEYALFLETEELLERYEAEERVLLERQEQEFIMVRAAACIVSPASPLAFVNRVCLSFRWWR